MRVDLKYILQAGPSSQKNSLLSPNFSHLHFWLSRKSTELSTLDFTQISITTICCWRKKVEETTHCTAKSSQNKPTFMDTSRISHLYSKSISKAVRLRLGNFVPLHSSLIGFKSKPCLLFWFDCFKRPFESTRTNAIQRHPKPCLDVGRHNSIAVV